MAYKFPERKKKAVFTVAVGEDEFEVPAFEDLPLRFLAPLQEAANRASSKKRREQEAGASELLNVINDVLDTYAPGASDLLLMEDIPGFIDAWQEASGQSLGESSR